MKNWLYYFLFTVLLLFSLWFIFFNTFVLTATSWNEALWTWNFSLLNPFQFIMIRYGWKISFSALNVGIMEETARYIFLLTFLTIFKQKRANIFSSIIWSSIIFSLLHVLNIFHGGNNLNNALMSIVHAFGFGCLMALIFLYTGKLWLNILIHTFADFLVLTITPLGYGNLLYNSSNSILASIILTLLPLLVTLIYLLIPSIRKYLKQNIERMLDISVNFNSVGRS